jgi:hypothetical protein
VHDAHLTSVGAVETTTVVLAMAVAAQTCMTLQTSHHHGVTSSAGVLQGRLFSATVEHRSHLYM